MLAHGNATLSELVHLVGTEFAADACSVYAMRPGDILELVATEGLLPSAIGRTRLRVGEGITGLCAATGKVFNLPDARAHPDFVFRAETGEAGYASLLAVPVRRAGHTLGIITMQAREQHRYTEEEIDVLETVALLLAEILAGAGATGGAEEGLASSLPRAFAAKIIAPGIAIGPVVLRGGPVAPRRFLADDPEGEILRLQDALERMQRGLRELLDEHNPLREAEEGPDLSASREVLEAYRLIATDAGWLRRVTAVIHSGLSAEAAVQRVVGEFRDRMRRIPDPYLRERLADLEDLGGHLLSALAGDPAKADVEPGSILLARRLGPAELLGWHARGVGGVVIEEGSPAGHAAILARALGMPALSGARGAVDAATEAEFAILDADEGQLLIRPDAEVRESYLRAIETRSEQRAGWVSLRDRPAATADGTQLGLMLNVGLALELDQLDTVAADGIGLFRTEIAMLARGTVTDMHEQAAVYARVLDAAGDRPVLFRTLDLGGDKVLPGVEIEGENPALGWRSIRVGLDRPSLMRRQLRALLLAASGRELSVMFPMIATTSELRAARNLLLSEARRVRPAPSRLRIGTMLEVPALMWQLDELLPLVDFVSVGSNDLMQFLFAADRSAPGLSGRYDLLSPPVFNLLEYLLRKASEANVPVSFCGDAASRPLEAIALAGIGFRTLSMPSGGLMPVKAALADLDLAAFRPVLRVLRQNASGVASLRKPITTWAREHGVPV
ncbi:MAG: GAF domain-containing protein [Acetobacteraceae bacterium]|nr:GAF domain-containing protein [Acetobacteraceae bacterium]